MSLRPPSPGVRRHWRSPGANETGGGLQRVTRTTTRISPLVALLLTILVGICPSTARADGDPASDVLVSQTVFFPADAGMTVHDERRLVSLLGAARHDGLPIRLAIISSPSDLGAVSELWGQPRAYAHFLGYELSLTDRDWLLVVMPNGVGFDAPIHSAAATYGLVNRIPSGRSGPALASAAQAAVLLVAETERVRLVVPAQAPGGRLRAPALWRPTTDRVFGLAVLALLAAAWAGGRSFLRRSLPRATGSNRPC
jgi:hypothetical protein